MTRAIPATYLTTFLVVLVCSTANAATIFDNFGPGDSFSIAGRVVQGPAVGSIGDVNQAAAFTTGANESFLTSISIGINAMDPPNVGTGPLDIELAVDAGGIPGAVLRTLPVNVGVTGEQVITGVDDGSQMLMPNTTYWVIADGEGSFNGAWRFNTEGDMGITAGQTEPNPWNPRAIEDRYAFRVEGRVVPEPSSCLMILFSTAGLLMTRRTRFIS